MPRARGPSRRGSWAPAVLALLALLAAASAAPTATAALGASLDVEAPLIDRQSIDVEVGDEALVAVDVDSSLLPKAELEVPILHLSTGTASPKPRAHPAGPPPESTPPGFADVSARAAGEAAGSLAIGAVALVPAFSLESLGSAAANWFAQVREWARPATRAAGRALKALPFLLPLFSRVSGERLLENPVRARLHDMVAQDPGLTLQDVRDRAGIAWGTTVHHLLRLERHGHVVSVRHGNHRRWFPVNTPASRLRRELSALAHPTAHRVAQFLAATPGTDQKSLCAALGLRNPAASKHLARFESLGLVLPEWVGRSRAYHPTPKLAETLAALESLGGIAPTADLPAPRSTKREARETVSGLVPESGPLMSPDVAAAT